MAYQVSPSLPNPRAVIDALATFAVANGWTLVYSTVNGDSRTICLRIPGVTDYIHIWNTIIDIRSRISVGYSAGIPPAGQPDVTRTDCISNALGSGAFPRTWFFANGTELDVVILRPESPSYCHLAFGCIKKYGVYNGGTYADGTYFNQTGSTSGNWDSQNDHALFGYGTGNYGYVRADCVSEGRVNSFHPFSHTTVNVAGEVRGAQTGIGDLNHASMYSSSTENSTNLLGRLINATDDNVFSGRTFLHPIEIIVRRAGDPPYFSPAGYIDNRRYVWLANYDPEQELEIAGETWKIFPVVRRGAYSNDNNALNASRECAFAIRKVL